jgi:hypothetical protein
MFNLFSSKNPDDEMQKAQALFDKVTSTSQIREMPGACASAWDFYAVRISTSLL